MTENNQKQLLPVGFYDLLGEEARINQESTDILLQKFASHNYKLVKTPLVEFEDSLQINQKLKDQSFKMVDGFGGKTLVIRSDITTQISRLLSTRLKEEPLPLRLCYSGDVLKVKNDDLYADRQLTQTGIELIGDDSVEAIEEVLEVTIQGLEAINLPNLLIDFCIAGLLESMMEDLKITEKEQLKIAIRQKNISAIKELSGKYCDSLINLTFKINDIEAVNNELSKLPVCAANKEKITNLQNIIHNIKQKYPQISVLINVFDDSDLLYHNNIGFTIFDKATARSGSARGLSYPIARGGKYAINQISAIGTTIYINNLRKILGSVR